MGGWKPDQAFQIPHSQESHRGNAQPHPASWENLYGAAGAEGTLFLSFRNPN